MLDFITFVRNVSLFLTSLPDSTVGGLFNISEDTGVISVLSKIDREMTEDIVTLIVKVLFSFPQKFLQSLCLELYFS